MKAYKGEKNKSQKLKAGGQYRGGHNSVKSQKLPHLSKKLGVAPLFMETVNINQQWDSNQ